MGTEGTADTILNGARITAQADQNLSNAIIGGFNNLSNSFRERTNIYQQMVNSTLKVKELEVDSWFKNRDLELKKRELDIREAQNIAEVQYKKDYLKSREAQARKAASLAPAVSAIENESKALTEESIALNKQIEIEKSALTGIIRDPKTGKETLKPGLEFGTDEWYSTSENIEKLQKRHDEIKQRAFKIRKTSSILNAGGDPQDALKTLQEDNSFINGDEGGGDGPNPLLPKAGWKDGDPPLESFYNLDENGDILSGKVPQENYPSPNDSTELIKEKEKFTSNQVGQKGPLRNKINKAYLHPDEFLKNVNRLTIQAERDKEPFDLESAKIYESRMDPKELETIKEKRKLVLKDAYITLGEMEASRYYDSNEENEKVINRKLDTYRRKLQLLGEDPFMIDMIASEADMKVIEVRQSKEFNDLIGSDEDSKEKRIIQIAGELRKQAEADYGKKQVEKTPTLGAFDSAVPKKTSSIYAPDGSVKTAKELLFTEQPKIEEDIIPGYEIGYRKEFDNKFINKQITKDNPFAVTKDYVKWLTGINNPAAFGINDFEVSSYGEFASANSIDKNIVKQRVERRKREIVNDPERAFYFWLDQQKEKDNKIKELEGFKAYQKEIQFVNQ